MKLASFEAIARALQNAGVRYLVAGGLAVNAHGFLRFTKDVDLVMDLAPENVRRAFDALASLGYRPRVPITADEFADADMRQTWIREKGMQVLQLWSDELSGDTHRHLRRGAVPLRSRTPKIANQASVWDRRGAICIDTHPDSNERGRRTRTRPDRYRASPHEAGQEWNRLRIRLRISTGALPPGKAPARNRCDAGRNCLWSGLSRR